MSNVLNMVSEDTFTEQTDGIVSAINEIGGGGSITVDTAMSDTSTNAVQNKVIKEYVDANTYAPFIVTLTAGNDEFVADKTFGEIKAAADNNKIVIFKLDIAGSISVVFIMNYIAEQSGSYVISWADAGDGGTIKVVTGTTNDYPTISA